MSFNATVGSWENHMTLSRFTLKTFFLAAIAAVFMLFQVGVTAASAAELDEATRTIALNGTGDTVTMSQQQVIKGRRLFASACAACHLNGITKTDPNVGLDPETLALATPKRDSLESLVDYLHNPTTYDGETEISERHPSTKSVDIFPKMRSLTEDDLVAISGHILLQPKVMGIRWGNGKVYF
jgi:photosystem II cytochrome c550